MIDLNNYEEYFLLYADNELTEQERQDVNAFVLKYPHLKAELEMLLETVIKPDEKVVLFDKESLLKFKDEKSVNSKNCEEYFVLYHDGELDKHQQAETEEFVKKNAGAKEAFELFGSLKFTADKSIRYPDKASLYKREKPVIRMMIRRAVAAAVLVGFVLFGAYTFLTNSGEVEMVAGVEKNDSAIAAVKAKEDSGKENETSNAREAGTGMLTAGSTLNGEDRQDQPVEMAQRRGEAEKAIVHFAKSNAREEKDYEVLAMQSLPEVEEVKAVKPIEPLESETIEMAPALVAQANITFNDTETISPEKPVEYISYASNQEQSENYIFYNVTIEEFRRTKVGAFLKQVSRVIERTDPVKMLLSGENKDITYRN